MTSLPRLPSQPPIWREGLVGLELARLLRDPVWRGIGVEHADDQPVILIPGFLAGDRSLGPMTTWLRRTGHRTRRAGVRSNVDCSSAVIERISERLEAAVEGRGQRIAVVGQSRGGAIARVLAVRRPDLVSGIAMLGTPVLDSFAVHPLVRLHVLAVGALGTVGAPGLFRRECLAGECCADFWEELQAPFPANVGFVSIYSRRDGVVDWRACLDPAAEHVEVSASHCGMAVNADVYRALADSLARFRAIEDRPRRAAAKAA
jgi:triacylglycerol lipase